jgi:hypothetical protein
MRTIILALLLMPALACTAMRTSPGRDDKPGNSTSGDVTENYEDAVLLNGTINDVKWKFGKGYAFYAYQDDPVRKGTLSVGLMNSIDPERDYFECDGKGSFYNVSVGDSAFQDQEAAVKDYGVSFYLPADVTDVTFLKDSQHPEVVNPVDALYFSLESFSVKADSGKLKILKRTKDTLMGVIEGRRAGDDVYEVAGRFEVKVCPAIN